MLRSALFTACLVCAPLVSYADSQLSLNFEGQALSEQAQLENDVMKPVYDTVLVPRTCSRQVQVGSHQDCRSWQENICHTRNVQVCGGQPVVCHWEPQTVCGFVPRRECQSIPDYRSENYDCSTYERQQVGEELDYKVAATVHVKTPGLNTQGNVKALINLSLVGRSLNVRVKPEQGQALYVGQPELLSSNEGAQLKTYEYDLPLRVLVLDQLLAPMKTEFNFPATSDGHTLSISTGRIYNLQDNELTFSLIRPAHAGETWGRVLVSKKLVPNEFVVTGQGLDRSLVTVYLDRLNFSEALGHGDYEVSLLVRVPKEKLEKEGVLNPEALSRLTTRYQKSQISIQ